MSQQQNQLKRELLRQREIIEDLQAEIEQKDSQSIEQQRENQKLRTEIEEVREKMIKFDELMKEQIRLAIEQEQLKNQGNHSKQQQLENELELERQTVKRQKHLIDEKEDIAQKYKQVLKELSRNHDLGDVQNEIENYKEDRVVSIKQMQKLSMDYNQLSNQMNDILAENKLLRKMAKVPAEFGFDLTKVKLAEQEQASDYKQQLKYLEKELKELEKERTQLRHRLRTISSLYSNRKDQRYQDLTEDQYQLLDEYALILKQGLDKLPVTDKTQEYAKEIQNLRGQIEVYEKQVYNANNTNNNTNNNTQKDNNNNLERDAELKEYFQTMIQQLQQQNQNNQQNQQFQPQSHHISQQSYQKQTQQLSMSPVVLPDIMGGYDEITEGYSHRFNTKLNIDYMELYAETGFDQVGAKYEIGHLQLQNIECIKLLELKEKEYQNMQEDVADLNARLKGMIGEQNLLFKKYFEEEQKWSYQKKQMENENKELAMRVREVESQKKIMEEMVQGAGQGDMRYQDSIKRIAILDVNLIRTSRKYEALEDEYKKMRELYYAQQKEQLGQETYLQERLNYLIEWKEKASEQLRQLLKHQNNSIDLQEYKVLVEKYELMQDRYSNMIIKESELRQEMSLRESEEREKNEFREQLEQTREELGELTIEYELVSKRLEAKDSTYRKFKQVFSKLVETINSRNIQVSQLFEQIDLSRNGKIERREFIQIISMIGFQITQEEEQSLFDFLDVDGSNSIEYNELLMKLKRGGVVMRKKEDHLIYEIFKAIQEGGMTLQQAFTIFDSDGDNLISKDDMKNTFSKMQKVVDGTALDYVFNLADTSGDGLINYDEFNALFIKMSKEGQQNQAQMGEVLDWKFQLVLTLHKVLEENQLTVQKLFQMLDQNNSNSVDEKEFVEIFSRMRLQIENQQLTELFQAIDSGNNKEISYNELINYISKAQKEHFRITRLEQTKKQREVQQMEEETYERGGHEDKMGQLEIRVQMLTIKDSNHKQRVEQLLVQVEQGQTTVNTSNKVVRELQDQLVRTKEEYYKEKQRVQTLMQQVNVHMTNFEGNKLMVTNDKLCIENTQLRAAMNSFKQLNDLNNQQNKSLYLLLQKQRYEVFVYKETIRGLQSEGDKQVLIGKLYHQVMVKKQQLADIYLRYDQQFSQISLQRQQVLTAENALQEQQQQVLSSQEVFTRKMREMETKVTDLRVKIIPTLNVQKVEAMGNMVKELTGMKSQLEIQNKKIREHNIELSIDLDYFKVYQDTLRDLEIRLKKSNNDEMSSQLIEMSGRLKDYKLAELKARRESQMSLEKEEYHQRLNRQQLQTIKQFEQQLAGWDVKYAQREEFWMNRYHQSTKMLFNTEKNLNAIQQPQSQQQQVSSSQWMPQQPQQQSQQQLQQQQELGHTQKYNSYNKSQNNNNNNNKRDISQEEWEHKKQSYEILIEQHRETINNLEKRLESRNQGRHEDQDIQTSKLAMAAQKTIQTLQGMLKDQKQELEYTEERIEEIIQNSKSHKEKDILEIQRLQETVMRYERENEERRAEMATQVVHGSHHQQSVDDIKHIAKMQKLLTQKDQILEEHVQRIKLEISLRQQAQQKQQELDDKLETLQNQLFVANNNNSHATIQKDLEKAKKMIKLRDKEIQDFQKSIKGLQEEFYRSMDKQSNQDGKYQDIYARLLKQNVNSSELETALGLAKKKMVELNAKLKEAYQEIQVGKKAENGWKEKCAELELKVKKAPQGASNNNFDNNFNKNDTLNKNNNEQNMQNFLKKGQSEKEQQIQEELKMKFELLQLENQKLKKNNYKGLFDDNGYLRSEYGGEFKSAFEIKDRVQMYLKQNWQINVNSMLSKDKYKVKDFFIHLEKLGLKLKERDKNIFKQQLLDFNDDIDASKFIQFVKNQSTKQVECKIQGGLNKTVQPVKTAQNLNLSGKAQMDREKETLMKNNEILKKQGIEHRKERETFDKQMGLWKDKCAKLEREMKNSQNQVQTANQHLQSELKNNPIIQELKEKVYRLEEQNIKLNSIIDIDKNTQIFQQGQQIEKMTKQYQTLMDENLKIKHQNDKTIQRSKEQSFNQINNNDVEKDLIVQRLKEKLDINRNTLEHVEQKLFDMQKQNFELKFIKENFDMQIDRFQRRISELEDNKQYNEKVQKKNSLMRK